MEITIKLYGVLRQKHFKEKVFVLPDGLTVKDVVGMFTLPDNLIGALTINGKHAQMEDRLQDGDELTILPLMDGG